MVEIMTKLFQDFALPETITSDGSPRFISDNMSSIGKLDNMAVTKALLMYRNSPSLSFERHLAIETCTGKCQ